MLSIVRFDFIITLVTIDYLLQRLLPLTFLQTNRCDLVEAAKETVPVISLLQERADPEVWNMGPTLYEGAVGLATKFEVQQNKPC